MVGALCMSVRVDLEVAASICGVKPGTIYRWVSDGHVTSSPGPDGANWYDVHELLHWVDARNPDALMTRAGMTGEHATRLGRVAVAKRDLNRVSSRAEKCA